MFRKSKFLSFLLCFCLLFEQTGFAQVAGALDISGYLSAFRNSFIQDKFRPLHLRSLGYDNNQNNFRLLLDKGDLKNPKKPDLEITTKNLLNYFFVGITLPNDTFWVNLRPDSENNIIDPDLATTDVGKILLEADLQLKKDTAKFTSPETPEGKEYWDKLYQKAGELLGYENVTIPTLTRPWIVPGEIIIRETKDNAYIYKATLKVMLEQDYLKDSTTYNFDDPRLKTLNEYSSQLIRDLIIPKLTKEVNTSQRYAPLRQVYYSLILAQWFKSRFYGKGGLYSWLINRRDLTGLESKTSWSKTTYFKAYQKSFKDGEYNIQQPVYTPYGQTIRSYFSGGFVCNVPIPTSLPQPGVPNQKTDGPTTVTAISGDTKHTPLSGQDRVIGVKADGGSIGNPTVANIEIVEEAPSPSRLPAEGPAMPGASSSTTVSQGQVDQFSYAPDIANEGQILFELANNPNISTGRRAALLNKLNDIYWNYYRMRAKADLSTPYSLNEIESQLKQLDQDSKNYALPTMDEVIGMVGNEQIRKNLENILGRIKQYKDTTFPEADFGIASSNDVGATRLEHEKFHEEQKFSGVIERIANEIGAQKRSDGRWDLRGAVNKAGGKITTLHGELRIESDGILIIIDNRFNKDHAGRDEAAIYARNEIKVYHELSELRSWINFARNENIIGQDINIQEVNLGQKLRDWVNGRGVFSVNKAELLERQKKVREAAELFHVKALNDEKARAQEVAVSIFRQKAFFGEIFFNVRGVELEDIFANYDPIWDVFIISDDNMDKISDAARGDGQGRAFNFAGLIVLSQTDFKRLIDGDQDAFFVIRHEKRHNDYRSLHGEAEKLSEEQKIIDEIYANYAAYVDAYGMEEVNFADGKWANTIVSALLNDYLDKKMERSKRETFTVKITAMVHLVNEYFNKGKGSLALEYLRGADSFDRVLAMSRDKAILDSNLAYYISFFSQHRDGWQTTSISTEGMEFLIQEFENFRQDYSKNYGNENSGTSVTSYQNEEDFIIAADGGSREDRISYARKLLSGFRI